MRAPTERRVLEVSSLLFGSGFCALVYQVVWLRELRLVFGSSTAASAAVLAIFMGGLGFGGALLGRFADRAKSPLGLYARLELGVALSALLSPYLLAAARAAYVALGGASTLGAEVATLVRLLLSALILGVPTVLMGGTLPAASRAVVSAEDAGRHRVAILYGINTLGAVAGAALATLVLLENWGARTTLVVAALANVGIAVVAGLRARSLPLAAPVEPVDDGAPVATSPDAAPARVVYAAAALVGFVFFLMELVWYRMLAPLLGGTTYTFGLILAVALLGIGLGGAAYALLPRRRPPTLASFALSCGLEGLMIAIPFALGDRLAYVSQLLRSLGTFGFGGFVVSWTVITAAVLLPAAIVAGYQFPLLVALLGRAQNRVGRQVGWAYAWNTWGAIGGSLAGGFGLVALLSAPGAWRLAVWLLGLLAFVSLVLDLRRRGGVGLGPRAALALPALAGIGLILTPGPTASWRHSAIGAGRVELSSADPRGLRQWAHDSRRRLLWEGEGKESSVALLQVNSIAFAVNGKIDGNAVVDAGTQVWLGLVGAALHPEPRRSLVVGLGTGSSAGWLAAIPEMERVDVVELEPEVVEVARASAVVNRSALENPRVRLLFADAREVLLTTRERYDLIASEPSNPYRAGVASLYTEEFYRAVAGRLHQGGIFLQWVQGYEIDSQTVETLIATLAGVFPQVQIWQTMANDLLLVARSEPLVIDLERLRRRLAQEPFREALQRIWRTNEVEGFLARLVAAAPLAREMAQALGEHRNTDNLNHVEFGFVRTLGRSGLFRMNELRGLAHRRGAARPPVIGGDVDWARVDELAAAIPVTAFETPGALAWSLEAGAAQRFAALAAYTRRRPAESVARFQSQEEPPRGPIEVGVLAMSLAALGDEAALPYIEELRSFEPLQAAAALAELRWRQRRPQEALEPLVTALRGLRDDPWVWLPAIRSALTVAREMALANPGYGERLLPEIVSPFVLLVAEDFRLPVAIEIAASTQPRLAAELIEAHEPWVPWERSFLVWRLKAYEETDHPLAERARRDLAEYLRWERRPIGVGILPGMGDPSTAVTETEDPFAEEPPAR